MRNTNLIVTALIATLMTGFVFTACSQRSASDPASSASTDPNALNASPSDSKPVSATPPTCSLIADKAPLQAHFNEGEVTEKCSASIAKAERRLTQLIATADSNTAPEDDDALLMYESAMADFNDETNLLGFQNYVSTNPKINAEGAACAEKIAQFGVDVATRRPLYQALVKVKPRDAAEARLLSETLNGFESNGLKLDDSTLAEVKALRSKISNNEVQFQTNLNADASAMSFTAEQLAGAPADFLKRLKRDGDKYIVTAKNTDFLDLMQNVSVEATRKAMMLTYLNRGGATNLKLLEEAVELRAQYAHKLGFNSWADYQTAPRMAKSAATVLEFLNGLRGKLALRNHQDQEQLLKFKKQLDPTATVVNQWDVAYLTYQLQKRDYSLDNETIRQYFPASTVVAGIFDVYSKLLGVQFVPMPNAEVWANEVKAYEIHNASDCRLIGYFYTDLMPRDGKYNHAAAFSIMNGRRLSKDKYSLPVSSIVANFAAPTADKPSLLTHAEVEVFFHEFGHIMHQTLTRAPYASLSGSGVARDFVEAPSQMLENWVWNADVLNRISGHYLHPEQKLPVDLLQKMLAARNFQQGTAYTKQLLYALFDMKLHTHDGPVDATKTYNDLYREIVGQEPMEGGHFGASFGHLMGSYDAGYYGYLWSEVYAQDMFTKFPSNDLTNAEVGARYRSVILEQGNMKDAIDLLREFLGREPNSEAFFKKLGL